MSLTSKRNKGGQLPDIIIEDVVIISETSDSFAIEGQSTVISQTQPDVPLFSTINLETQTFQLNENQIDGFSLSGIVLITDDIEVSDDRSGFFFQHITSLT